MKDTQIHTTLSNGKSTMKEYIDMAPLKDIDELTFTDNYKYINLIKYYKEYLKHKDLGLKINFGIEMDLKPSLVDKIEYDMISWPFDIIICSSDYRISDKESYLKYIRKTLENINIYKYYSVYNNLDNVIKYGELYNYKEYREVLDEILKLLIKKDKGININKPDINLLKRYKELNGKIVTVGSNAYKSIDLGNNIDNMYDVLEEIGFNEIALYHDRVPDFIKINTLRRK